MDFTTAARVKKHLELTTSVGDALLAQLIPAASLQVEKFLGFSRPGGALRTERTETHDVHVGDSLIWLRSWPVEADADFEVKNAFDRDFDAADVIDEQLYHVDRDLGRIIFDRYGLIPGPGALQIVYTAGLGEDADDVVADYPEIATATDIQAAFLFKRKDTLGMSSFSAEGGSISFLNPENLVPQAKALLEGIRRETY